MLKDIPELQPLQVVVMPGRWAVVPTGLSLSVRELVLIQELKIMGIDETVSPGTYLFNIVPSPFGDIVTLLPGQHSRKKRSF